MAVWAPDAAYKSSASPLSSNTSIAFVLPHSLVLSVSVHQCHSLFATGTSPVFHRCHSLLANRAASFSLGAFLCYCKSSLQPQRPRDVNGELCILDQKLALAKRCSREATLTGAKAAVVPTIASAVPTLTSVRMLPWAKANINPTRQALIISMVAGMAYFIAANKKILSLARRHSFEEAPEHLRNISFQGTSRPHPAFFRP